jgi:histidinol dehydrogenase
VIALARLDSGDDGFAAALAAMARSAPEASPELDARVRAIVARVREEGDAALVELTAELDGHRVSDAAELVVPAARLEVALRELPPAERNALEDAGDRVRAYHERQMQGSWSYREDDGTVLGQEVRPLDRVGVYVPGGKAAYPSSVLMNVIPARVAGVPEIVMTVPAPGGDLSDMVLAAARVAGVERVVTVGGAQAVAALAYGTPTVPAVDKIVGPGNAWVAAAKRQVFGVVGIDMIAGPSEIVVVCDGSTPAEWVAMDLFSQAEHDEDARAVLVCPDTGYVDAVLAEMARLLPGMERAEVIRASLEARGACIVVRDLDEALDVVNEIAPEHLELSVAEPRALLARVRNAGAIFLGRFTAEALGDYCAGPNHVLPTARTARFSSPLGVYDFQKRSSVIECSAHGARRLGAIASVLARGEGLTAHARSAELRLEVRD